MNGRRGYRRADAMTGVLYVLLATLGLSMKAIFVKLVYRVDPGIDAVSILTIRFVLAVPFFLVLLWLFTRKRPAVPLTPRRVALFLGLGSLGFYLAAILDFSALAYIPAALERVILFLYPGFVVLISAVMRPSELSRNTVPALLLSTLGLIMVFARSVPQWDHDMTVGVLLVFGAAVVFAVYTIASVRPISEYGSVRFTCWAMIAAAAMTVFHALSVHGWAVFDHHFDVYALILPMAVFSTVLPLILMAEGIRRIGASKTSIIAMSGPVLTIALADIVLGEPVGFGQVVGGVMVGIGVVLISSPVVKNKDALNCSGKL